MSATKAELIQAPLRKRLVRRVISLMHSFKYAAKNTIFGNAVCAVHLEGVGGKFLREKGGGGFR